MTHIWQRTNSILRLAWSGCIGRSEDFRIEGGSQGNQSNIYSVPTLKNSSAKFFLHKEALMSIYFKDNLSNLKNLHKIKSRDFLISLFTYGPPGNQGRFKQDQQVPRFLHLAEQLKLPELKKKVWDMKAQENQYFQSEERSCKGVV